MLYTIILFSSFSPCLFIIHLTLPPNTFYSGLAYAGAQRDEVKELLENIIGNTDVNILESSMAALSLSLVFAGTCNDDIGSVILQRLMESSDEDLTHTASRFMCLGGCSFAVFGAFWVVYIILLLP